MTGGTIFALPKDLAQQMKTTGVWQENCPVSLERLALLKIRYVDFAGKEHDDGELITLDVAAAHVANLFAILYRQRFPICKLRSVHHYSGDDERSMADNNTSCFNFRAVQASSLISLHSYGLAIDINPLQNPCVCFDNNGTTVTLLPQEGRQFLNRRNRQPGMVEDIVPVFAEHGFFIWGGTWTTPIDYQHFQPPRGVAELLALMDKNDGERFFDMCIAHRDKLIMMPSGERLQPLIDLYIKNQASFFDSFFKHLASI
jgi:hypothetical protein